MAASATFALKAGVWFRRGRRCMVSPDSQATACPLSGRNSTYRPVQISGASSVAARPVQPGDNANSTGALPIEKTIGIVVVAAFPASAAGPVAGTDSELERWEI